MHTVAVENQDGSRSLLVVNDNYRACEPVVINFPTGAGTTVRKIVNDPVRKHEEVEEFAVNGGHFEHADVLSPMSLTVYTTAPTDRKGPCRLSASLSRISRVPPSP